MKRTGTTNRAPLSSRSRCDVACFSFSALALLAGLPAAVTARAPQTREEYASYFASRLAREPQGRWLIRSSVATPGATASTTRCYVRFADGSWEILRGDAWGTLDDVDAAKAPEKGMEWEAFRPGYFARMESPVLAGVDARMEVILLPSDLLEEDGAEDFRLLHHQLTDRLTTLQLATESQTAAPANLAFFRNAPVFMARPHPDPNVGGMEYLMASFPAKKGMPTFISYQHWMWQGDSGFPVLEVTYRDTPGATTYRQGQPPRRSPSTVTVTRRERIEPDVDGDLFARRADTAGYEVDPAGAPTAMPDWHAVEKFLQWATKAETEPRVTEKVLEVLDYEGAVPDSPKVPIDAVIDDAPKAPQGIRTHVMVYKHDGDSLSNGKLKEGYIIELSGERTLIKRK
jgi:hypothetical protein